jgi:hypothetical protein
MDGTAPGGAVRIGVQNVGSRVVIRYRLRTEDYGPHGEALTDVIGVLVGWEPSSDSRPGSDGAAGAAGIATVERAGGERVAVPLASVVAAKTLPPAPVRRASGAGPQPGRPGRPGHQSATGA